MRLINADKLHPDCMTKDGKLAISQSQIANAPTVEIDKNAIHNEKEQAYLEGYEDASKKFRIPQGEWIENSDKLGLSYICPFCGHEITGIPQDLNYCCKCGAKMLKGGAE